MNLLNFMYEQYKIRKPIRLIELFAGIGAQAKALENLGVDFEHYRICEFDKYAVASYNAVHGTGFKPSDITKIHASDLNIVDTDKYEYIMTYSFPCQDLSLAGKGLGCAKGSGTRSGLLWEVERLLNECKELPQILLMENVPQVHGEGNKDDFSSWIAFLESKGYTCEFQDLNAKNYGVPQNRDRCFMISILGQWRYEFPEPIALDKCLADVLEDKVDEKYYLSDRLIDYFTIHTEESKDKGNGFRFAPTDGKGIGKSITCCSGNRMDDNFIKVKNATKKGYDEATFGDGIDTAYPDSGTRRGRVQKGMAHTITCLDNEGVLVPKLIGGIGEKKSNNGTQYYQQDRVYSSESVAMCHPANLPSGSYNYLMRDYRIRKLTPLECWRLMGFSDEDFYKAAYTWDEESWEQWYREEYINTTHPPRSIRDHRMPRVGRRTSNAQLYKQAGNSIVVDVLMAIFKQLIGD